MHRSRASFEFGHSGALLAVVVLEADIARWSAAAPQASPAEQAFRRGASAAAGVDGSRIEIMSVAAAAGSVVVTFRILPAPDGGGRSVPQALAAFQTALSARALELGLPVDYSRSRILTPGAGGESGGVPAFPYNYAALGIATGAALLAGAAVALLPTTAGASALARQRRPLRRLSDANAGGLARSGVGAAADAFAAMAQLQLLFVLLPATRNSVFLPLFGTAWERALRVRVAPVFT
eukprot:tig00000989_g6096.t1